MMIDRINRPITLSARPVRLLGEPVAEPGLEDEADHEGDERHERQDVLDDLVDRISTGLVEDADDPADALPNTSQNCSHIWCPSSRISRRPSV